MFQMNWRDSKKKTKWKSLKQPQRKKEREMNKGWRKDLKEIITNKKLLSIRVKENLIPLIELILRAERVRISLFKDKRKMLAFKKTLIRSLKNWSGRWCKRRQMPLRLKLSKISSMASQMLPHRKIKITMTLKVTELQWKDIMNN